VKAALQQSSQLFVQDLLANGKWRTWSRPSAVPQRDAGDTVRHSGVTGADMKAVDVTLPERK